MYDVILNNVKSIFLIAVSRRIDSDTTYVSFARYTIIEYNFVIF